MPDTPDNDIRRNLVNDDLDIKRSAVIGDLRRGLEQYEQAKLRDQDPAGLGVLIHQLSTLYVRAVTARHGQIERNVAYRLAHVCLRAACCEKDGAFECMEERWLALGGDDVHCERLAPLELSAVGLARQARDLFGTASRSPLLLPWASLYEVATMKVLERLGEPPEREDLERAWTRVLAAFLAPPSGADLGHPVDDEDKITPRLLLFTPLDVIRLVCGLPGGDLDQRVLDLALRDPVFAVRPEEAECFLFSSPPFRQWVAFRSVAAGREFLASVQRDPNTVTFELLGQDNGQYRITSRLPGSCLSDDVRPRHIELLMALAEHRRAPWPLRLDRVITRLWPGDALEEERREAARNRIHTYSSDLRKMLGLVSLDHHNAGDTAAVVRAARQTPQNQALLHERLVVWGLVRDPVLLGR